MASVETVKRALRALVDRTDTARPPAVALVTEAAAAVEDVERAAGFAESVGLDRLADAVDDAAAAGYPDAAAEGREALAALRAFRRVANGGGAGGEPATDASGAGPDRAIAADHFHRVHGTDKRGGGQGTAE